MPQMGGGVCVCASLGMRGREDQLLRQRGGREPQAMKVEGDFWACPCCLLDWQGARALVAYLIDKGRLGGLVIFSSSSEQVAEG
jgi:hypothetical protein